MRFLAIGLLLVFNAAFALRAEADQPSKSYYLIGNSLTWDTMPSRLDGDVQWHVDCGKSLPYIFAHPQAPCVKSSTLWPQALKQKQYDFVSFQSHYGATLAEDVTTISVWVELQSRAIFVIHTGWAHHAKRAQEYANEDISGLMQHSPAYIDALLDRLRTKYPDREFRQTHAIDLLAQIAADIGTGRAPIEKLSDLHRDAIHMRIDSGRYLMHSAMRQALGQPPPSQGFEDLSPDLRQYLDRVLATKHEPNITAGVFD